MKSITKIIAVVVILAVLVVAAFMLVGSGIKAVDMSDPSFIPILVASSLVDSVNPCAFSVLIITVAFLASLGVARQRVLVVGGSYILGIFAVYLLIGLGFLRALDIFGVPHVVGKIGAGILLFFGLSNVLSYLFPSFPIEFKIPGFIKGRLATLINKASLPAAFFLGGLVALFEFPCTGGPYLLILGLLHDSKTQAFGLIYLLLYNLIFILPLVVILLLASDKALFAKAGEWKSTAAGKGKFYGGLAMIFLALVIFFVN